MKMLRHPNILMFQDGLETDKSVFIVSERVQTLYSYINESKENDSQKENEISWGLHQIAVIYFFQTYSHRPLSLIYYDAKANSALFLFPDGFKLFEQRLQDHS